LVSCAKKNPGCDLASESGFVQNATIHSATTAKQGFQDR
jgi:hypothetical protein